MTLLGASGDDLHVCHPECPPLSVIPLPPVILPPNRGILSAAPTPCHPERSEAESRDLPRLGGCEDSSTSLRSGRNDMRGVGGMTRREALGHDLYVCHPAPPCHLTSQSWHPERSAHSLSSRAQRSGVEGSSAVGWVRGFLHFASLRSE